MGNVEMPETHRRTACPVTYVIASMVVGGTQTHLLQVLRLLDRRHFEPHLVCLRSGGRLLEQVRELAVPTTILGVQGSLRRAQDLGALRRLARLVRGRGDGVVHGYLLRGNFYAAIAGRMARSALVVTSKRGLHLPASPAERLAVRVSNRLSTVITGNSPAVLDFTRQNEPTAGKPLVMIPSGIDVERFDRREQRGLRGELGLGDGPLVGSATTFRPKKGYPMLLRSFASLLESVPNARLLIAGEDRWQPDAERMARELGILERVVLLGRRSDMPEVYSSLDVFVLASRSEGMSNALLEAMAMRLAVVATAVGGNPAVVRDGESGFLVPYGDHVAMAARVSGLLSDASARHAIGANARQRVVEQYSASAMVSKMESLYRRLLRPAFS